MEHQRQPGFPSSTDRFLVAFPRAIDAVQAAVSIQFEQGTADVLAGVV